MAGELVAYSVQELGTRLWRWRLYGADGGVTAQGVEASERDAERNAAAAFWGASLRAAAWRQPACAEAACPRPL